MAFNWLFGPPVTGQGVGVTVRSLVLDLDVVDDIRRLVSDRSPSAGPPRFQLIYFVPNAPSNQEQNVEAADLVNLSATDLEHLVMTMPIEMGEAPDGIGGVATAETAVYIDFRAGQQPSVNLRGFNVAIDKWTGLPLEVARVLLNAGRPRPQWLRIAPLGPVLFFVLIVASWIWFLASTPFFAPFFVFSLLVVVALLAATVISYRWLRPRLFMRFPGHRFRGESRADTRRRRSDRHANLRVALITAPVSLAVGIAGTLITLAIKGP